MTPAPRMRHGSLTSIPRAPHSALGYLTASGYAANFTATDVRLRNPDQAPPIAVASPAPNGVKPAEALIAAG